MWQYNDTVLCHHGIKGMRWGVRRFQKEDGALTNAGKKRYDDNTEKAKSDLEKAKSSHKQAQKRYNKATAGGILYNEKAFKNLSDSDVDLWYAKKEFSDAKTRVKIDNQSVKSKRQLKFEQQYTDKGLTKSEAEVAAYKRVRTEKIIAVTAGITMAAATAYVAYKHYDNNVDKIIKPGTMLQNISTDSNKGVSDAFYASMKNMDNAKYRGMYGSTLKKGPFGAGNNQVFETKIGVDKGLKLASRKSAIDALSDLVNTDKSYAKALSSQLNDMSGKMGMPEQEKLVKKAIQSLKNGKVNAKVYEALNLGLADHRSGGQEVSKGLYDALKSKGYDAIKDINDSKYSGYKSSNPIIVFNGSSKTAVKNIREVGAAEINKNLRKAYADIISKEAVKAGASYAAVVLGVSSASTAAQTKLDNQIVTEYRKQHPNSTLTYNEIIKNAKKG